MARHLRRRALAGVAAFSVLFGAVLSATTDAPRSEAVGSRNYQPAATMATATGALARVTTGTDSTTTVVGIHAGLTTLAAATSMIGGVGLVGDPRQPGYWILSADGQIDPEGRAAYFGSIYQLGVALAAPIVGMAATPSGRGYWLVGADGGVFSFGNATYFGSLPGRGIRVGGRGEPPPIVGIAAAPSGRGYWLVGASGTVYCFGTAPCYGSLARSSRAHIVGIATVGSAGYDLVSSAGGVFSFGGARFHGSIPRLGLHLLAPIVAITVDDRTGGYWLLGADGGVFSFDALFYGSKGGSWRPRSTDNSSPGGFPYFGIAATPKGTGYWLANGPATVAADVGQMAEDRYSAVSLTTVGDGPLGALYGFDSLCTGSGDGHCGAVFLFLGDTLVASTAKNLGIPLPPGPTVLAALPSLTGVGLGTFRASYPTYRPGSALCCATGPPDIFLYHVDPGGLSSRGSPPKPPDSLTG